MEHDMEKETMIIFGSDNIYEQSKDLHVRGTIFYPNTKGGAGIS